MCSSQKIAFYSANLVCPNDYVIVTCRLDHCGLSILFINDTYYVI